MLNWTVLSDFRVRAFLLHVLFAHVTVPRRSGSEWVVLTNLEPSTVTRVLLQSYSQNIFMFNDLKTSSWPASWLNIFGCLSLIVSLATVDFMTLSLLLSWIRLNIQRGGLSFYRCLPGIINLCPGYNPIFPQTGASLCSCSTGSVAPKSWFRDLTVYITYFIWMLPK